MERCAATILFAFACSDFKEHFQFARGKSVRRMMFSHRKRNLRRNSFLARVHAADCIYETLPQGAFEEISAGSCPGEAAAQMS
jgi:hypothetical protein